MSAVDAVIQATKDDVISRMVGNDFFQTDDGNIVRLSAITSVEHCYEYDERVNLFIYVGNRCHDLCSIYNEKGIQYSDINAFMCWFVETYLDKR